MDRSEHNTKRVELICRVALVTGVLMLALLLLLVLTSP